MVARPAASSNASPPVPMAQVEAWYDEHAPRVLGIALGMMRDRVAAEAIVVEVFVIAHHGGGCWPGGTCGRRLAQLTQQRAAAQLRRERELRPGPSLIGPGRSGTRLATGLGLAHGDLVEACWLEGYTVDELCARFDLPRGVVLSRLRETVAGLARLYENDGSQSAV